MTTATKTATVRIPYRVYFYMTGTSWYQGKPDDDTQVRLAELIRSARVNSDRSLTVPVESDDIAWRICLEADHALNAASWGDNTLDDLADQNAARALIRRMEKIGHRL